MALTCRFLYTNLVQSSAYTLSASSSEQNHPLTWLRNHLLGKPWRSASGWTIYTGFNDKIDFNRGGAKAATIAAGTYATTASLCAAIVTALEAADATPVWACSYDSGTGKFTISSDLAFTLLCGTGANLATSAFKSLGFIQSGATGSDTGSATSQVAGFASYQSTHFVGLDLLTSSPAPVDGAAFIAGHNVSSGGAVYARRDATSIVSAATAGSSSTLSGTTGLRGIFWASITARRYWALVIEDCQNANGYAEVAVWFLGTYGQPSFPFSEQNPRQSRELSTVAYGASGAHWHSERAAGGSWEFVFENMPSADQAVLEALRDAVPVGKAWLFATDAVTNPVTRTYYGFLPGPMSEEASSVYRTYSFPFEEILA